jgi:hypothetical protein
MYCSLTRLIIQPRFRFPFISRGAPHQTTWKASISERRNYRREMSDQILPTIATSTVIVGFFYMPQSCDMGQTALLPLRRKTCWGFFARKISYGYCNQTKSDSAVIVWDTNVITIRYIKQFAVLVTNWLYICITISPHALWYVMPKIKFYKEHKVTGILYNVNLLYVYKIFLSDVPLTLNASSLDGLWGKQKKVPTFRSHQRAFRKCLTFLVLIW